VNAARQRIFVGALKENFNQLIVLENGNFRLVPIRRNHEFFAHETSLFRPGRWFSGNRVWVEVSQLSG
jgi:hypothetical protein